MRRSPRQQLIRSSRKGDLGLFDLSELTHDAAAFAFRTPPILRTSKRSMHQIASIQGRQILPCHIQRQTYAIDGIEEEANLPAQIRPSLLARMTFGRRCWDSTMSTPLLRDESESARHHENLFTAVPASQWDGVVFEIGRRSHKKVQSLAYR